MLNSKHTAAIANLRKIAKGSRGTPSIVADGIDLAYRGRNRLGALKVAELVRDCGGTVWECRKTRTAKHTGDRTWLVLFTVGIAEDSYIGGHIDRAHMNTWIAEIAERA